MTNQFTLNSDQISILETANQFGKKELYPLSEKMDNAIMESLRNKLKNMFDSFGGILSSLRTGGGFRKTEEESLC